MTKKWETVRSRNVLKDRWIDIRADDCVTASGIAIAPYYVLTYPDWVNVVAITPDGQLILVRQYRHAVKQVITEIPGGMMDHSDVSSERAARRELLEETGYISSTWELISSFYPNPATHTNRMHVYLAVDATRGQDPVLDAGEEGAEVLIVPIAEILSGLKQGRLAHGLQVSALLLGLAAAGRLQVEGAGFSERKPST